MSRNSVITVAVSADDLDYLTGWVLGSTTENNRSHKVALRLRGALPVADTEGTK